MRVSADGGVFLKAVAVGGYGGKGGKDGKVLAMESMVTPEAQDDPASSSYTLPPFPSFPPLPPWYLWLDIAHPGYLNMAIDQALLERACRHRERWLRLYCWQPHCLSFGRHEPATRRYDPVRIAERGLDVVRRPTGGRAVWHGREVTYSIVAPADTLGALRHAYLEIHRMLLRALRALGAPAQMAPSQPPARLDAGACFAQPVGGEIMLGGKKVVGSAQLREGGALLQHGSILLHDDQAVVQSVAREATAQGPTPGSAEWLELGASAGEIAQAVGDAAIARWGGAWDRQPPVGSVLELASAHVPRFQSDAWTWRM